MLFDSIAFVSILVLLDAILQFISNYFQGLPSDFSKSILSEGKLLYIFWLFDDFYRPSIHFFFFLFPTQSLEIRPQNLIFKQRHNSFEEATYCNFYVIVIVAFHPMLYEKIVFCWIQYNFIVTARKFSKYFLNVTEGLQQSALSNLEYPSIRRD